MHGWCFTCICATIIGEPLSRESFGWLWDEACLMRQHWKAFWVIFLLLTNTYTTEETASNWFIPSALWPLRHMKALLHQLFQSGLKVSTECRWWLLLWFSSSPPEWDLSEACWIFFKDGWGTQQQMKSLWVLWIWFSGLILKCDWKWRIEKHPYAAVHTEWYSKLHVQGQQITTWKTAVL